MHAVWFTGCLAAALFVGLAWALAPLTPGVLAIQLAFTPQAFASIIHVWPPEHLNLYRAHLAADVLLLASYGAFGYLLATRSRVFAGSPRFLRTLATWALPLAALFDAIENALHGWFTAEPRFGLDVLYAAAGAVSVTKWVLLLAFGGLVAHALLTAAES